MPRHVRIACAVWLLAVVLAARPAHAQNLLANPSFDGALGFTPWTADSGGVTWSSAQCPGIHPLGSGSARFAIGGFSNAAPTLSQCVAATPGSVYQLSGSVFLEQSSATARGVLRLRFVEGTCESWSSLGFVFSVETLQDECIDHSVSGVAPPQTEAVVVELGLSRPTQGSAPIEARFDDLSLIDLPEPAGAGAAAALTALASLRRKRSVSRCRRRSETPLRDGACTAR